MDKRHNPHKWKGIVLSYHMISKIWMQNENSLNDTLKTLVKLLFLHLPALYLKCLNVESIGSKIRRKNIVRLCIIVESTYKAEDTGYRKEKPSLYWHFFFLKYTRLSSYRVLNSKLQILTVVSYTVNYIVLTDSEWKRKNKMKGMTALRHGLKKDLL